MDCVIIVVVVSHVSSVKLVRSIYLIPIDIAPSTIQGLTTFVRFVLIFIPKHLSSNAAPCEQLSTFRKRGEEAITTCLPDQVLALAAHTSESKQVPMRVRHDSYSVNVVHDA